MCCRVIMNDLEKTIYYNNLLSIYGGLLTDVQKEILGEYYEVNLSISEIAENRGVSRAAIEDAIRKGTRKLNNFEATMKLYEKHIKQREITAKIKQISENPTVLELIEELEDID